MRKWLRRPHFIATLCSLAALFMFFGVMLLLNHLDPPDTNRDQVTDFNIHKEKKKKKNLVSKPKPQKKSPPKSMDSLKPQLNSDLLSGGLDLGLDISNLSAKGSSLLGQQDDVVMTEDVVDRVPQVQYRGYLEYPAQALGEKLEGFVTVNLLIDKEGQVKRVKLVDSQPSGIFESSALQSVKHWQFVPAEFKGKRVSVWVQQKIQFQVN